MAERGILKFITRRNPTDDETCAIRKKEMSEAHALSLYEVGAVFVILATGAAISVFVFFLEITFRKARILTQGCISLYRRSLK